jgi:uncharacterized protein YqgC (DUF456 family)
MDILLIVIGSLFIIVGLIGCLLPILPGPPLSWLGILFLYFTSNTTITSSFLLWWLAIAIIVTVIDYIVPIWGTKKLGGTKMGIRGSMIGLIVGLFFPPVGIIVGPFIGALIAELIHDTHDTKKAFKSAVGSFIGFVLGTGLKLAVSLTLAWYFVIDVIARF